MSTGRALSALTIAGSDSGGGAGIQADLKAFAAHGVHGLSAIAALTAQHTRGVTAVEVPPVAFLRAQIDACFDDFAIGAVKIGMLGSTEAVEANAARAVAAASFAYGSIAGRLDLISARTKRRRIGLRADDGHSVICDVHGMDEGAYMAAFAKDVLVIGTIKRNISGQAVSVMVDELRVREALPPVSARALLGAQPDLGGDLSAVEYIRSVRRDG